MAPNCVTEIVNNTQQVLDMKVANSVYVVDLARLERGAKHFVPVDCTDTYEEYEFHALGPDGNGANVVVTSDDCCDYQRITITEADGTFSLQKLEPRVLCRSAEQYNKAEEVHCPAPVLPKRQCNGISSWEFWIGLSIF